MADLNYRTENAVYGNEDVVVTRPNWGSIWAGTFTFIGIWAIFGSLGAAIFASAAAPITAHGGLNVGMVIWAVVLTIVAMFVAGRVTGQLASSASAVRMHAVVMFGLSVTAALVILVIAGNALGNTRISDTNQAYMIGLLADLGWPLFVALFLGCCAAVGGAMSAGKEVEHKVLRQQPSHA